MANSLNKVTTKSILDATVATADIADSAITTAKIASDNVTTDKIAASNVTTATIAADAVTGAKIADDAVGAEHIEVLDAALQLGDSVKAQFGASNDLEVYHDGSNSYLDETGTGSLILRATPSIEFRKAGTTEKMLYSEPDAQVDLYYDNAVKISTSETGATVTGSLVSDNIYGRNLIINGNMRVAQRGDTTGVQSGYGGCDRFQFVGNSAARATLARTGGPSVNGFSTCQLVNVTTADTSLAAGDYHYLGYRFEGLDLQHLKKGTANAESVTLSFWVSSPKTGTHIIQLYDNDNARHICKSYTVSSADTWEKKTITFPGDTTGGLDDNNEYSLQIYWWLLAGSNYQTGTLQSASWDSFTAANTAVGQVNCLDSTSNNFKLTGVQFEIGKAATQFEHISYGENLSRCQRYYQVHVEGTGKSFGLGYAYNGSEVDVPIRFTTSMRTSPSFEMTADNNYYRLEGGTGASPAYVDGNWTIQLASEHGANVYATPDAGITAGSAYMIRSYDSAAKWALSAEL